jgi:putative redox protein
MPNSPIRVEFEGHNGAKLAARLDVPNHPGKTKPRAYALFAHCFTCSKDILAARRIAGELARQNIAVLRFDFTGLGSSKGEFASTNFSSNIEDLVQAADWLRAHHEAPALLIGHSLGGTAVLAAAHRIAEAKAVVTIASPMEAAHVLHNLGDDVETIEREGAAEVDLGGRKFRIEKQFIDDAREASQTQRIGDLKKALLVLHSPTDPQVGVENATSIFVAAKHPKSFVSLDGADHLLTRGEDAVFAANVIGSWATRYLPEAEAAIPAEGHVEVSETSQGKFQQAVRMRHHAFFADEPESYGGDDTGPTPYDLVAAGLGACTTMTLRMYADRKGIELPDLSVEVSHGKVHGADCAECDEDQAARNRIDRFERRISVGGNLDAQTRAKVLEIADKCPVHKTLEHGSVVATQMVED